MKFLMTFPFTILFIPFFIQKGAPTAKYANQSTMVPIDLPELLQNEDIRNTWQRNFLDVCLLNGIPRRQNRLKPSQSFVRQLGYEQIRVEVLSQRPAVLRIVGFLADAALARIAQKVRTSSDVESQGVEGHVYSEGYRGRRADGLWLLHHEGEVRALYKRIQHVLTLNPAMGEDFLVLKYGPFGHYAPHYDHLDPMPPSYDDGWFAFFGNRLATALLLVETASLGGSTVFPNLDLNIFPQKGDLLLWMNADSNDRKERDALHAACPIVKGEKIAVSLWIRGNFQNALKCSMDHPGYDPENLIRSKITDTVEGHQERPTIPRWIFD